MPVNFIPQTDAYSIPIGLVQTKTVEGGTAFVDNQGNPYIRTASGFQYSPSVKVVSVSTAGVPAVQSQGSAPAPVGTGVGAQPKSSGSGSITLSQIVSLPNLQPGSSGDSVKSLQNWLIQNGFPIPDGATGYYGDQTKAAVAAWQAKAGLNTQGNPGYFGPISKTYLTTQINQGVAPASSTGTGLPQTDPGTGTPSAGTGSTKDITVSPTGVLFKDTAAYKALSQNEKDFVDMSYNLITVGGEDEAKIFAQAVDHAKAIADPYFASQLSLAKGEVLSAVFKATGDYEKAAEAVRNTRDDLLADVSANKDKLTLDQQAELARQANSYSLDLQDIADTAAEKGITFATGDKSRALMESNRATKYQDVIQSDTRTYNFNIQQLEARAARGDRDAQLHLENLKSNETDQLTQIGQNAEKLIGSSNLPPIDGYTPTGNIPGSIQETKVKNELSDVAGFVNLQKGLI